MMLLLMQRNRRITFRQGSVCTQPVCTWDNTKLPSSVHLVKVEKYRVLNVKFEKKFWGKAPSPYIGVLERGLGTPDLGAHQRVTRIARTVQCWHGHDSASPTRFSDRTMFTSARYQARI